MSQAKEINCFGLYGGSESVCGRCAAARRCKAILISDGFTIGAAVLKKLEAELPASNNYRDSDRASEIYRQMIEPPEELSDEDKFILAALEQVERQKEGKVDPEDIDLE